MYSCMEQSKGGRRGMYPWQHAHQNGVFPAPWQLKCHKGSPGVMGSESVWRTGLCHHHGSSCLSGWPSDGHSQESLSTWGCSVRGSGNRVWAAKSWRDLGKEGFESWSWGRQDWEVFQPGLWHRPSWGKGCLGWVTARSKDKDRPPCSHGKDGCTWYASTSPVQRQETVRKVTLLLCDNLSVVFFMVPFWGVPWSHYHFLALMW